MKKIKEIKRKDKGSTILSSKEISPAIRKTIPAKMPPGIDIPSIQRLKYHLENFFIFSILLSYKQAWQ